MSDKLRGFIDGVNAKIPQNYSSVLDAFENEYDWPELDPVRDEICKCIICGLYQAAIVLTNYLLEDTLKVALVSQEVILDKDRPKKDLCDLFDKATRDLSGKPLWETSKKAREKGIISEEEKQLIDKLRSEFRNPYSHADNRKIFEGVCIPTTIVTVDNSASEGSVRQETIMELSAAVTPFVQGMLGPIQAEKLASKYFLSVDGIVRKIRQRIFRQSNKRDLR